jgi:dienelactone hydrolase
MRTTSVLAILLSVASISTAQDADLAAALQKIDARIFAKDSVDAKLRADTLKKLRDDFNRRDVETWRSVKTKADWEKLRDERLAKLRASLGKFPPAPKETKVITAKRLQGDGFTVENLIYESRPGLYVTANLYVPLDTSKPMPGFIIVHSHHNPKTQGELQDMGALWARQGCLVLVPDMLGHGERRQHPFVDAKSFSETYKVGRQDYFFRYNVNLQLSLVGESLMGWMVWDLMRGVDVLHQRPNIDKAKIMVFGSVAGGGDPCAVFAALDPRVTAAAPFNFGGPQPETKFPLPEDAEVAFNYMGGGSWESTRGLRLTARDGFPAWLIVGSIAPRGLIYGHEFAWDEERDPVWARFNKIWGEFYGARDKLASAKGAGSVTGTAPTSTHCNNIGAAHRKPIYPTLTKWFGLPIPKENKTRFEASELQCWTEELKKALKPKMVHELAQEIAQQQHWFKLPPEPKTPALRAELRLLGIKEESGWAKDYVQNAGGVKCKVDTIASDMLGSITVRKQVFRYAGDPTLALPVLTLIPISMKDRPPVVIAFAQDGKAGFLKHRAETIAALLKNGVAVCLPDLRGTGETAADGRGRTSGSTSYSATELMHGRTVAGTQLQELVMLLRELPGQGFGPIALWGDSFAEPNDAKTNFAVPHDVAKMPRQSEPMGGLLAQLGGVFGGKSVKALYVRGGLISYRTLLDSPFCYYPHDAVIPGMLTEYPLDRLIKLNEERAMRLESLVDGHNRRVAKAQLSQVYRHALAQQPATMVLREEASSPAEVAEWLTSQVKR